jgi:putative heme iron utilization protein
MSIKALALEAKHLCRRQHSGVLGTQSTSMPGYPFGSIVPFVMDHNGNPIIYISEIALHTRNIKADNKVSLTIFDATQDDSQANGRATMMGDAELADNEENANIYFTLFPQAKAYQKTHDFHFYRINTVRVRYIGGFGKIHWIDAETWLTASADWHATSQSMVDHMNKDHQSAMCDILQHYAHVLAKTVTMLSVFEEGAHYMTEADEVIFVPFEQPCRDAMSVRQALVNQTHTARAAKVIKCSQ